MINPQPQKSDVAFDKRVMVTVVQVKGSAPREEGAQMLVLDEVQSGSIGGGSLEYDAVLRARAMLNEAGNDAYTRLSRTRLEPRYDQCCGGVVVLLFEYFPARSGSEIKASEFEAEIQKLDSTKKSYVLINQGSIDKNLPACRILVSGNSANNNAVICEGDLHPEFAVSAIQQAKKLLSTTADANHYCELRERSGNEFWVIRVIRPRHMELTLFGAGHVGQALVQALSAYDCSIRWVDNRANVFPENVPENTRCITTATPAAEVGGAPPNSYFLVMTHSHSLDYEICDHILARDDFVYLGLIGSRSKALRFSQKFKRQGLNADEINKITCPIGIGGIRNKKASAIAISVAAQLLQLHEAQQLAEQHESHSQSKSLKSNRGGRYAEQKQ